MCAASVRVTFTPFSSKGFPFPSTRNSPNWLMSIPLALPMLRRSPMACSFRWYSIYPASRSRSVTERERALFPSRPVSQVNIVSGLKEPIPKRFTIRSTCFIAAQNPARPSATISLAPVALFFAVISLTIASVSMRSFAARLSAFS